MEKKILLHRKSQKHDTLRGSLIPFLIFLALYLIIDYLSHWLIIGSFLKYGFSGDGWWFVFVCAFLAVTLLIFYGVSTSSQVDKDEFLYIEGDELIYLHGKTKKRVNIKDIYEIVIGVGGIQRVLHFKTRNPKDVILFGNDYSLLVRSWISVDDLTVEGIKIYQILRKINPNIELKRVVPRKYRATKNAVIESYEGGKWVPEEIGPWWGK